MRFAPIPQKTTPTRTPAKEIADIGVAEVNVENLPPFSLTGNGESSSLPVVRADCGFILRPAPVKKSRGDGPSARRRPAFLRSQREADDALLVSAGGLAWAYHVEREGLQ